MSHMAELEEIVEDLEHDEDETRDSEPELAASDRCDRCGAQAWAIVQKGDLTLLFCGHHFSKYEAALRGFADAVYDRRDSIPR